MRIEKISDKQIRCTLTQADLQNHHINIGELAYGSEKARSLFQEMLSQASREFNFHAENMPLILMDEVGRMESAAARFSAREFYAEVAGASAEIRAKLAAQRKERNLPFQDVF